MAFAFATLALILAGGILFLYTHLPDKDITGKVIKNHRYMYTKAICTKDNYCQDYEISCLGKEIVSLNQITGASIQNPLEWEDTRDKKLRDGFCNIGN